MVVYADNAGIDDPAFMQLDKRPLKGRVTSVLVQLPDCRSSRPRPFRGFAFPAAVRVADTYVRARGEGKPERAPFRLFLSLPSCFRELTRLLSLVIRGVRGDLSVPVPFLFGVFA